MYLPILASKQAGRGKGRGKSSVGQGVDHVSTQQDKKRARNPRIHTEHMEGRPRKGGPARSSSGRRGGRKKGVGGEGVSVVQPDGTRTSKQPSDFLDLTKEGEGTGWVGTAAVGHRRKDKKWGLGHLFVETCLHAREHCLSECPSEERELNDTLPTGQTPAQQGQAVHQCRF